MDKETKVSFVAWLINIVLFAVKITAGLLSGSLAVLSDAFNSLTDIISYLIIFIAVRFSRQAPDADHPYGHRGAQPLAAFIVAVFQGVLAFEILKTAVSNLLFGSPAVMITAFTFAALLFNIIVKSGMSYFLGKYGKQFNSTSLRSISTDSRNDVLASMVAVLGLAGVYMGDGIFDNGAAIVIALYIFYAGYRMARESMDFLMSASPPRALLEEIGRAASSTKGVKRVMRVSAHYIGDRVHAELEVVIGAKVKPAEAHGIEVAVQKAVEGLDMVESAFVHIDYG
ncbi:MAG: cation diffusion facilitator family transporter [Candidatus ainarchaeum sp.]|nr:cation diffusion facilitator family transporter [Candidatus ainarchaeum sp.]